MAFTTTDGHTSGASVMRVEQGRMLYGLREIAAALHCSEKSVLRAWQRQQIQQVNPLPSLRHS